jgi:hypothetical protein
MLSLLWMIRISVNRMARGWPLASCLCLNYRRHQWKSWIFPPFSWKGILGSFSAKKSASSGWIYSDTVGIDVLLFFFFFLIVFYSSTF